VKGASHLSHYTLHKVSAAGARTRQCWQPDMLLVKMTISVGRTDEIS
jgi:hypothetical protein